MVFYVYEPKVAEAGWYATGGTWVYRKVITINSGKVEGTSDLASFPILVDLTDADLATYAQADGDDILFTSSDGTTKLDHEIELYTSGTGRLTAWVRIPTLDYNDNTIIYMYYGNAGASSQQNATGVWDSSYKGVWHLPNGTTLTSLDSTSNANNSSAQTMTAASGQIDGSATNSDTKDITIPSSSSLNVTNPITVQGWINSRSITVNNQPIISKGSGSQFRYLLATAASGKFALQLLTSATTYVIYLGCNTARSSDTWYHVVATYDGSNGYCYVNGAQDGTNTGSGTNDGGGSSDVKLGSASGLYLNGYIDEVRLSSTARSADWIATEYNNQSATSTFYTISGAQTSEPADVKIRGGGSAANSNVKIRGGTSGGVKFR